MTRPPPRSCPASIARSSRPSSRLERAGQRDVAWEIRRKALVAYSTHWDTQGRKSLEKLNREARQVLASKRVAAAAAALSTGTEPA